METQDQIIKTVNISIRLSQLTKPILMISLGEQTLVVIEGEPITNEGELTSLAKEVPLKDIATQAK